MGGEDVQMQFKMPTARRLARLSERSISHKRCERWVKRSEATMRGFGGMTRRERKSGGKPRRGVKRVPAARQGFSAGAGRQALPARTGLARPRSKKGECILRKDLYHR